MFLCALRSSLFAMWCAGLLSGGMQPPADVRHSLAALIFGALPCTIVGETGPGNCARLGCCAGFRCPVFLLGLLCF